MSHNTIIQEHIMDGTKETTSAIDVAPASIPGRTSNKVMNRVSFPRG